MSALRSSEFASGIDREIRTKSDTVSFGIDLEDSPESIARACCIKSYKLRRYFRNRVSESIESSGTEEFGFFHNQ